MTILVCKCKRTGCLAATQVPEKGMHVYALAFFTGWLRGLGWKRLLLRSDNERALYGPTPECEACTTLAAGAQRVTKPHSDECRARMEELMQRDEDALVQQRLHTDRPRRGSTVVEASEDERRNPDVEMIGSGFTVGERRRSISWRRRTRIHENRNRGCEE